MSFLRQCVAIVLISLILGTLIELTQAGTNRTADILDVIRNLVGTLLALFFSTQANERIPKTSLKIFQALTVAMLVFALMPFAAAAVDEWLAMRQFPILSDFETPFEIGRWSGNAERSLEDDVHYHGQSSMKVVLNTSNFSGASLRYFPSNWQDYQYLHLNIFNPQKEPLKITCRVHDRRHAESGNAYDDRFNHNYILIKGWNLIEIPLEQIENAPRTRKLDLCRVQELGLFVHRLSRTRVIFIDRVILTNKADSKPKR